MTHLSSHLIKALTYHFRPHLQLAKERCCMTLTNDIPSCLRLFRGRKVKNECWNPLDVINKVGQDINHQAIWITMHCKMVLRSLWRKTISKYLGVCRSKVIKIKFLKIQVLSWLSWYLKNHLRYQLQICDNMYLNRKTIG